MKLQEYFLDNVPKKKKIETTIGGNFSETPQNKKWYYLGP
jgi:hypothetical protein